MMRIGTAFAMALLAGIAAAGERIHGADHDFSAPGLRILWGVAKNADDADVVLRIVIPSAAYTHASLEGVDPFTKTRETLIARRPIGAKTDFATPRAGFGDWPSREVHLFRGAELAVTVYYLGAPDTTPEFANSRTLEAYFESAAKTPPRR